MSETHETLEQAEHAAHGADPFTMRVAMSMAIIAAVLATISLIGHRKHNEALQNQGDSNRLNTESAAYEVRSSNAFAFYQAKRARVDDAEKSIASTKLYALGPNSDAIRDSAIKEWKKYIDETKTKESDIKKDDKGFAVKNEQGKDDETLGALVVRGKRYKEMAEEKTKEAKHKDHEYHHVHHQADWLDLAHLAVELGLVLCTVAVLTKRREFWLAGIAAAIVGIGLAGYGVLLAH